MKASVLRILVFSPGLLLLAAACGGDSRGGGDVPSTGDGDGAGGGAGDAAHEGEGEAGAGDGGAGDGGDGDDGGDDGDIVDHVPEERLPDMEVTPAEVRLPVTRPGDTARVQVIVLNNGEGGLTLDAVTLRTDRPDELKLARVFRCPCGPFPYRVQQPIEILYQPRERAAVTGTLSIRSDDPNNPFVQVPIRSQVPTPELSVPEQPVVWDTFDPAAGTTCGDGRANEERFDVTNSGTDDMFVTNWELAGADADQFEVCPGRTGLQDAYTPGYRSTWKAMFGPVFPGTYSAEVRLQSNAGEATVTLTGTDPREPHLDVDVRVLHYDAQFDPAAEVAIRQLRHVALTNNGDYPTTITALALVAPDEPGGVDQDTMDAAYDAKIWLAPGDPAELGARLRLQVGRVHHREPAVPQPSADELMHQPERLLVDVLVVRVVAEQAPDRVRGHDLGGGEPPARKRGLAARSGSTEHDETRFWEA